MRSNREFHPEWGYLTPPIAAETSAMRMVARVGVR